MANLSGRPNRLKTSAANRSRAGPRVYAVTNGSFVADHPVAVRVELLAVGSTSRPKASWCPLRAASSSLPSRAVVGRVLILPARSVSRRFEVVTREWLRPREGWLDGRGPGPRRPPRVDRPRRDRASVPGLRDGPDGAEPRAAGVERGPPADQLAAAVDRGHLRVPRRRAADHDGDAWRPDRPPPAAAYRRRRLRPGLGVRGAVDQRRDADRGPRAARGGGGDAGAVDAVADPQHVRPPAGAHVRDRGVDHELFRRRGGGAADRRAVAGAVLVGLGVPAGAARDGAAAGGGAAAAARVPGSRRGQARPDQRGRLARRRTGGGLGAQTHWPR